MSEAKELIRFLENELVGGSFNHLTFEELPEEIQILLKPLKKLIKDIRQDEDIMADAMYPVIRIEFNDKTAYDDIMTQLTGFISNNFKFIIPRMPFLDIYLMG